MSWRMALRSGAESKVLAKFARRISRDRLRVLAFHDVPDAARFEAQMRYLSANYSAVSARELEHGEPLPANAVLVTFDDGDQTVASNAAPVMQRFGIPAVAFVVAGLIDSGEPYWWDVVADASHLGVRAEGRVLHEPGLALRALKSLPDDERRMEVARLRDGLRREGRSVRARHMNRQDLLRIRTLGVEIGNHSMSHPCLDRCDDETSLAEVREADDALADVLGERPRYFAYPNGNLDLRAERWFDSNGYRLGFLFDHQLNRLPLLTPLRISRIRVDATADLPTFRSMVSGLHPLIHRLRGGK